MTRIRRRLDPDDADRFAHLVLACLQREYPNQLAHVLRSDADARPPRELHPAFYGCYDWHSAVHGHWCLVRLLRCCPGAAWAERGRAAVCENLSPQNLQVEAEYLAAEGREGFERPYGLAWLLQLAAESREFEDADARSWEVALAPLVSVAVEQLRGWLPKLTHPVRSGEHSQTAFAMGLAVDWARCVKEESFAKLLASRTLDLYRHDQHVSLSPEPSGHDFLSPALAEADLVRRVLSPATFADWLTMFLGEGFAAPFELRPVETRDAQDGKLAHLDGLNLSRAWMLEGIAAALPHDDHRVSVLSAVAEEHAAAGLSAVTGEHYAGGHWLASFAVYLLSERGIKAAENDGVR